MDVHAVDVVARLAEIVDRAGRIDVLVNNAGGSLHTPYRFLDGRLHWQRVLT
jgi:3-oxoacyl-[acyl-carrier protein] reductase/2-hydroxycyclohexanecarboxyl-CoA dehydrogenase